MAKDRRASEEDNALRSQLDQMHPAGAMCTCLIGIQNACVALSLLESPYRDLHAAEDNWIRTHNELSKHIPDVSAKAPPPMVLAPGFVDNAKENIAVGRQYAELCEQALRRGGVELLDGPPNGVAGPKMLEVGRRLSEFNDALCSFTLWTFMHNTIMDDVFEKLTRVQKWANTTFCELQTAIKCLYPPPSSRVSLQSQPVSTSADAPAKRPSVSRSTPSEPHLLDVHYAILRVLAASPIAIERDPLWRIHLVAFGRDAIRAALDEMHIWGLVNAPPRSRRGVSIRDAGRVALKTYQESLKAANQKRPRNNSETE